MSIPPPGFERTSSMSSPMSPPSLMSSPFSRSSSMTFTPIAESERQIMGGRSCSPLMMSPFTPTESPFSPTDFPLPRAAASERAGETLLRQNIAKPVQRAKRSHDVPHSFLSEELNMILEGDLKDLSADDTFTPPRPQNFTLKIPGSSSSSSATFGQRLKPRPTRPKKLSVVEPPKVLKSFSPRALDPLSKPFTSPLRTGPSLTPFKNCSSPVPLSPAAFLPMAKVRR